MKLKLSIALLTSVCFLFFISISNTSINTSTDLSTQPTLIQQSIEIILTSQSSRRGEQIELLMSSVAQHESEANHPTEVQLFYIEFIKGYIASANNQFDQAKHHFMAAKQAIHPKLPSHILSRFYYEMSYIELEQEQFALSELNYINAENLFNDDSAYSDAFITISLGRTYDLAHVEEGSQLSIEQAKKTLAFAQQVQYSEMEDVYFILGLSYWNNNQTITGINFKLKALNHYIEKQEQRSIVYTLTDIGIDYLFLKNYEEAIRQLEKAFQYQNKNNNTSPKEAYYIAYKLHSAYLQINDMDNAKRYLDEAQQLLDRLSASIVKENFQTNQLLLTAEYLASINNPKDALALLTQVTKRHKQGLSNSFYHFDVTLYNAYGKVYNRLGEYQKSIQQHKLAENSIKKRNLFYLEDDTYFYLYDAYLKQGNYQKATAYLAKSHAVKTQQLNDNNQAQTQFLLHSFDSKKKENRIVELENHANSVALFSAFLVCTLLIVMGFMRVLVGKNKEISILNIQLNKLSLTDGLTGVANRRALDLYLSRSLCDVTVRSIMMIDIDYFKKYNDTYGHKNGDNALISVAQALEKKTKDGDILARFGGEEFIFIMNNTDKSGAIDMAIRIQERIRELAIPHESSDISSYITLSIGITTYAVDNRLTTSNEDFITNADQALYYSKNRGRNQYNHFFDIEILE